VEFEDACDYLEQARPGYGDKYEAKIEEILELLRRQPRIHGIVYHGARKAVVDGFRYVIYYKVTPRTLRVISVFHSSRNPKSWQRRV